MAAGLIKPACTQVTALGGEAVGKPGVAGVYTNQRLNLSKPWEGPRRTCQGLELDSGNPTVQDFRGASGTVRHGETVNPVRNRKSGTETPHLQRGAPDFYPDLEYEAIDRMYLNVYVPTLQTVGGMVGYLRVHRGQRFASTTAVAPMTEAFVHNIEQFVAGEGVDLITF